MMAPYLELFATDLRQCAGLDATLELDPKPDGLHVLTINGVDFYFRADGSGYDGWGVCPFGRSGHGEAQS